MRRLAKEGYAAAGFLSATAMLAALADQVPNLFIVDMMMPEMNGVQCIQEVKRRADVEHVPALMYTMDFSWDTLAAALQAGAAQVLIKGATPWEAFREHVRRHAGPPPNEPADSVA